MPGFHSTLPTTPLCLAVFLTLWMACTASAADAVVFRDPVGDDHGPGSYVYPEDPVYLPGSFDITDAEISVKGRNLTIDVCVNSRLEDPWGLGAGFAVQMILVFIDTDRAPGSGYLTGLPGANIRFSPRDGWEKVVILSPEHRSRIRAEIDEKAEGQVAVADILVPQRVRGRGQCISGRVPLDRIAAPGESRDLLEWGYQVVMLSNDGFPEETDLLTRKVNAAQGRHRFGGGHDMDCDPHVIDILAPPAKGGSEEIAAQHVMLGFECGAGGMPTRQATLKMVTPDPH